MNCVSSHLTLVLGDTSDSSCLLLDDGLDPQLAALGYSFLI
jgi:hypothetical protein